MALSYRRQRTVELLPTVGSIFPNLSHPAIDASSVVVAQRGIPPISERACAGHGQGLMIGSRVIWKRPVD